MRALAHPARIALWQHLLLEGPATATECAPVAELSPSACSYHLRQLARYGFVEQDQAAAANGRERPWRAVVTSTTIDELDDPVALMAARLLDYTLDERWQQVRRRYLATEEEYAPEWRRAAGSDRAVLYLTPDELAEHSEELAAHAPEFLEVLASSSWLESKISEGGTSTARVKEQIELARTTLDADASA